LVWELNFGARFFDWTLLRFTNSDSISLTDRNGGAMTKDAYASVWSSDLENTHDFVGCSESEQRKLGVMPTSEPMIVCKIVALEALKCGFGVNR